jgi:indolepyruvate ferredoxin oxidoreductase
LNGVQLDLNRRAFLWGRRAAYDLPEVEKVALAATGMAAQVIRFDPRKPATLDELVATRRGWLVDYQDEAWATRYTNWVDRVRAREQSLGLGDALSRAVAKYLFKLMAHKDEWEVARLYARPQFREELARHFEGDYSLRFHVAGGPFGRRDPATGRLVKREVGPWLMGAFRLMAPLRFLRGTLLDPFRHAGERKLARSLLAQYEEDLERLLASLGPANHAAAVKLAALPERIRGYGHVREQHAEQVGRERAELLKLMDSERVANPEAVAA